MQSQDCEQIHKYKQIIHPLRYVDKVIWNDGYSEHVILPKSLTATRVKLGNANKWGVYPLDTTKGRQ